MRRLAMIGLATAFLSPVLGLAAAALAGQPCYIQTWFNPWIDCDGSCATYCICPGSVLCDIVDTGYRTPSPIILRWIACQTVVGGTGSCPACVGGAVLPATGAKTVLVYYQTCTEDCP